MRNFALKSSFQTPLESIASGELNVTIKGDYYEKRGSDLQASIYNRAG